MTMTIEEYLEELPEPFRTQALANMWEEKADEPADDLKDAVLNAFRFEATDEGMEYWWNFLETLDDAE